MPSAWAFGCGNTLVAECVHADGVVENTSFLRSNVLLGFVRQLGQRVCGVLSGFDRLLFRGLLRCVIDPRGLNGDLYGAKVAMTDYGQHVQDVSRQLKEASLAHAKEIGCEIRSLDNSQERKKDVASRSLSATAFVWAEG